MSDKQERLEGIVRAWQGKRILVLGDVVADELVVGRPLGIAREAPVLVLQHVESRLLPGGATNVAANAAALGARPEICGVVGDDDTGRRLVRTLEQAGLGCRGVVVDADRPTTTKTRILAGGAQQHVQQLLLRLDRLDRLPVPQAVSERMATYLEQALGEVEALMISDYQNGVIHPGLIAASLPRAIELGRLVAVDAHGDLFRFRGAHLFTPNQPEAEAALGRTFQTLQEVETGGHELRASLDARAVLITRGQEGMTLIGPDAQAAHFPATPGVTAVDPTGAGDTVAAAFTLAVLAGATLREAAELANLAAGVVVARMGTATVSADDLLAAIAESL
ncbi:MAG TPA: PfkB family carbohydrate kinase [Chloroflexota bacterium]|nr:PfkB family carbohydrate kinase [Chloroflexota bacterium]